MLKIIFDRICNEEDSLCFGYLETAIHFIKDFKCLFLPFELVVAVYNKFMKINEVDKMNVYKIYQDYEIFIKYFKECKNKNKVEQTEKDLISFALLNADKFDVFFIQMEFQKLENLMFDLHCYEDKDFKLIEDYIDNSGKENLANMKVVDLKLSKEESEKINEEYIQYANIFKNFDSVKQINELMFQMEPLNIAYIKENINSKDNWASHFTENIIFDYDGKIINFDKENSKKYEFSIRGKPYCDICIIASVSFIYNIFMKYLKKDDVFKDYLKKIMFSNKLIENDKALILYRKFLLFFGFNLEDSVFDIISEFESSMRYYLKNSGMSIMKRNKKGEVINLNDIFNYDNNSYKSKLLEIIDDDYYFTLEYLLTDRFGCNFKNIASHRFGNPNANFSSEAVYCVLHIFRFYWFMQE